MERESGADVKFGDKVKKNDEKKMLKDMVNGNKDQEKKDKKSGMTAAQ